MEKEETLMNLELNIKKKIKITQEKNSLTIHTAEPSWRTDSRESHQHRKKLDKTHLLQIATAQNIVQLNIRMHDPQFHQQIECHK